MASDLKSDLVFDGAPTRSQLVTHGQSSCKGIFGQLEHFNNHLAGMFGKFKQLATFKTTEVNNSKFSVCDQKVYLLARGSGL